MHPNPNENTVSITGILTETPTFDSKIYGTSFYKTHIASKRISDIVDTIPVILKETLLTDLTLNPDTPVKLTGHFRSRNIQENGKHHLKLFIFVTEIKILPEPLETDENTFIFDGYVTKKPNYKITPSERKITEIITAINRNNDKTDYIPVITWNKTAKRARILQAGDHIHGIGRIQSRTYTKRLTEETKETRIAYEVSLDTLDILKDNCPPKEKADA